MMFGIICTYTLQFYVPVEILWPKVEKKFGPFKSPLLWDTGLRVVLVLITCKYLYILMIIIYLHFQTGHMVYLDALISYTILMTSWYLRWREWKSFIAYMSDYNTKSLVRGIKLVYIIMTIHLRRRFIRILCVNILLLFLVSHWNILANR